jgi:GNAT superfamily N-acetyltransferase
MRLPIHVQEIGVDLFSSYGKIPAWYKVESVFRVEVIDGGLGGFRLVEEKVAAPFIKDYDGQDDDNPTGWAASFDVSSWGIFLATDGNRPVGGAAVAIDAPIYPMDRFQRQDLAVLWDIRVHPDGRGHGTGSKLFKYAVDWSRHQRRGQLGLET